MLFLFANKCWSDKISFTHPNIYYRTLFICANGTVETLRYKIKSGSRICQGKTNKYGNFIASVRTIYIIFIPFFIRVSTIELYKSQYE